MAIRRPLLSVDQTKQRTSGSAVRFEAGDAEPRAAGLNTDDINVGSKDTDLSVSLDLPKTKATYHKPPVPRDIKSCPVLVPVQAPRASLTRIQVFVSAVLPLPHTSHVFDQLCQEYPSSKSLQMILRRAMDDYEHLLETGEHMNRPTDYPAVDDISPQTIIQTSRMIREDLLLIARSKFDPLGLETARTFGRKLATAALATFFEREQA